MPQALLRACHGGAQGLVPTVAQALGCDGPGSVPGAPVLPCLHSLGGSPGEVTCNLVLKDVQGFTTERTGRGPGAAAPGKGGA